MVNAIKMDLNPTNPAFQYSNTPVFHGIRLRQSCFDETNLV
ncbi:hypothetical protein D1AOALGA4SA_6302 [Olavius algarvensis Delta 1 endosymbiont]|nr:hypothetical protein D1AOALGA4SA_6302 [Olavius algarvensis Delta 1 endosymbiont]